MARVSIVHGRATPLWQHDDPQDNTEDPMRHDTGSSFSHSRSHPPTGRDATDRGSRGRGSMRPFRSRHYWHNGGDRRQPTFQRRLGGGGVKQGDTTAPIVVVAALGDDTKRQGPTKQHTEAWEEKKADPIQEETGRRRRRTRPKPKRKPKPTVVTATTSASLTISAGASDGAQPSTSTSTSTSSSSIAISTAPSPATTASTSTSTPVAIVSAIVPPLVPIERIPRAALLIGLNYASMPENRLSGCENDIQTWRYDVFPRFAPVEKIRIMTDASTPTHAKIVDSLKWLAARTEPVRFLVYSGHGAMVDRRSEGIVPVDYRRKGLVTDAMMRSILVQNAKGEFKLHCVWDCCHSGSLLDLRVHVGIVRPLTNSIVTAPATSLVLSHGASPYYNRAAAVESTSVTMVGVASDSATPSTEQPSAAAAPPPTSVLASIVSGIGKAVAVAEPLIRMVTRRGKHREDDPKQFILCLSACREDQVDADQVIDNRPCGALTEAFVYVASRNNWQFTYRTLLVGIHNRFRQLRLAQTPQIECSHEIDLDAIVRM